MFEILILLLEIYREEVSQVGEMKATPEFLTCVLDL